MKIIFASDLHGNLEALQCLPQEADAFLYAGDVVDYGPNTLSCLEFVQQQKWHMVRGNHDNAVANHIDCGCGQAMHATSLASRNLVWKTLQESHLEFLRQLPQELYLELGGCRFYITHAVPGDFYRYLNVDDNFFEELVAPINANVIIWGHTHIPYIKKIGNKTIVNPGSVGQPRDGIPQASWAEWNDGEIKLCRKPYSNQITIQKIYQLDLEDKFKQKLEYVLSTGKTPPLDSSPINSEI